MGPIGCPETSVTNYHSTLRNIPEERPKPEITHLNTRFIFFPEGRRLRIALGRRLCLRLSEQHGDFLRTSEQPCTDTRNELKRDLSEDTRCVQVSYSNLVPALLRATLPLWQLHFAKLPVSSISSLLSSPLFPQLTATRSTIHPT